MMNVTSAQETQESAAERILRRYWRANLWITMAVLAGWAGFGLGAGILWADSLNAYMLPGTGYPLGFWFAQQGAIVGFVVLILIYAIMMNWLDRRHLTELQATQKNTDTDSSSAAATSTPKTEGDRA